MKNNKQEIDYRVRVTAIIWAFATGMLGICVPLISISKSGVILPLAVIFVAGLITVSVWRSASRSNANKITKYQDRLTGLETRIIDLETICSSQDFNRERKYQQLESDQADL